MTQNLPEKKKRKLPPDALKHGDKHLMKCIFGDEVMQAVDEIVSEKSVKNEVVK